MLAFATRPDGSLAAAGRFDADSEVLRVLPVGERLVALTRQFLFLLDPDGLQVAGAVRLTYDPLEDHRPDFAGELGVD